MLNTFRTGRLQIKLLLLVLLASLPAFLLLFMLVVQEREASLDAVRVDLARVARLASLDRERHLEGAQQVLRAISLTPSLQYSDVPRCTEYLRGLVGGISVFFNFGVFNLDGNLRCNALFAGTEINVIDRPFFRSARDKREFSVSSYRHGQLSARKTILFGHPLLDRTEPRQVIGVVFASLDLAELEQSLAAIVPGSAARLVFTDDDGIILASFPPAPENIGKSLANAQLIAAIGAGKAALIESRDQEIPNLHAVDAVRAGSVIAMHTVVTMPMNTVMGAINRKLGWIAAACAFGIVAALLFAWRLGDRWISRRTNVIAEAALRIGEGEHGVRTRFATSDDELDRVGLAFDSMAGSLERRDADLRVTNQRLAESQRIAKLGNWEVDIVSKSGWWSPETFGLSGMKRTENSIDVFRAWVHPDDRARIAATIEHILNEPGPIDAEFRAQGSDGLLRWIHAVGECGFDGEGRLVKLAGITQDITERKNAAAALAASEERYRIMFENNPLPLWVIDPVTLQFLDVNDVACHRYGYSRAEFLGMNSRDIRPPEDIPLLEEHLRTETRAISVSGPWRHRYKDGSLILVEVTMHEATLNGKVARFVCPIDVTGKVYAQEEIRRMNLVLERKVEMRTEELSRSLALQQSLFDSVPQIVWLADLDGAVTFANRVWSEKIASAADNWKGDGWSKAMHPEDRERVMRQWREAAPSKDIFEIEYRLLHRDGGYHDYQVDARTVVARTGEPICWVGICNDVTDSRRREDALRLVNQELEAFSFSVSHDLRAPLRTIDGFSERLQLESADRLDEQGRHYLERIRAGAATMNELIDDLLGLAQVTRSDMATGRIDLSKLAWQVFDGLRQHQPQRPVEMVIQEGMTAIGDVGLLRVVLINLIGNALKFSGKRAVSRIEIGENALPGDRSMFFVRDNGAGFDPAYSGKMFGVFQRLHSAAEFPGTGIGLATVQRIIHRHGGHVSAEGAVGEGAKICFSLRRE